MSKGRVVLAMSGGVDSSVAACLLAEQGYDVIGLFMRTGAAPEPTACDTSPKKIRGCCSAIDAADAQRVADRLNIPFYALNFSEEFGRIKDYFVDEYLRGRTPNPCVVCNTWLKFGKLWEYAESVGADYIATGHYARIEQDEDGESGLFMADDSTKDQSYFLFGIRGDLLDRILFPIGNIPKTDVRQLAIERQLGVSKKPDSQEICFVPTGNYLDFIHRHRPDLPDEPGEIVDHEGKMLATHSGIKSFTIGQRKGLGVAVGEPRYVVKLRPESQQVVIGPRELLAQPTLRAERVNWLSRKPKTEPFRAEVKIRYLHRAVPALITPEENGYVRVDFDEPQQAVTPGQAVVFYRHSQVLGGGWII